MPLAVGLSMSSVARREEKATLATASARAFERLPRESTARSPAGAEAPTGSDFKRSPSLICSLMPPPPFRLSRDSCHGKLLPGFPVECFHPVIYSL